VPKPGGGWYSGRVAELSSSGAACAPALGVPETGEPEVGTASYGDTGAGAADGAPGYNGAGGVYGTADGYGGYAAPGPYGEAATAAFGAPVQRRGLNTVPSSGTASTVRNPPAGMSSTWSTSSSFQVKVVDTDLVSNTAHPVMPRKVSPTRIGPSGDSRGSTISMYSPPATSRLARPIARLPQSCGRPSCCRKKSRSRRPIPSPINM
jgi:hypothetical protein